MAKSKPNRQSARQRGRGAKQTPPKRSKTDGNASGAKKVAAKVFRPHPHLQGLASADDAMQLWQDFQSGKTDVLNVRIVDLDALDDFRLQDCNKRFVNFFTLDADARARIIAGMDAHHAVGHTIAIASDVVGNSAQALVLARESVSRALETGVLVPTMVDAGTDMGPVLASVPAALLDEAAYDDAAWQAAMKEPNPLVVEQQAALAEAQRQKEEDDRAAQATEDAAAAAAREADARMAEARAEIDRHMALMASQQQVEQQRVDVNLADPSSVEDKDDTAASSSGGGSGGAASSASSSAPKVGLPIKKEPEESTSSAFQLQMDHYGGLIDKRPSSPSAGGKKRKDPPSVASDRAEAKVARAAIKPAADLPAMDLVIMASKSLSVAVNALRFTDARKQPIVIREMKRVKSVIADLKAWIRNPNNATCVTGSGTSASMSKSE